MADQTYADVNAKEIILTDRENCAQYYIETVTLNDAATTAGMLITHYGETYPAADAAVTTDYAQPLAVIAPVNPGDNWDLDDVISTGVTVYALRRTYGRVKVLLRLETTAGPVAQVPGEFAAIGTEAGKIRKYVWTSDAPATESFVEVIGTFAAADAGDASNDTMIGVWF